jgi:beta-lactamase superfamily II metal-dependent hydrolase
MTIFRLTMLQASEGDSLILSYGLSEDKLGHVVIDGGRKATWPALKTALQEIKSRSETVDLLVLSHIDADHLDGLLEMIDDPELPLEPNELWYNGFDQLKPLKPPSRLHSFGFRGADDYTKALAAKGWPVNKRFGGEAIFGSDGANHIAVGDLNLSLLSPNYSKLEKLRSEWRRWRAPKATPNQPKAGSSLHAFGRKRPMPAVLDVETLSGASEHDDTEANGSSIAFIAEYGGRSVLLGADAHPDALLEGLTLLNDGAKVSVDLVKLPHHSSQANVTREVIEVLNCTRFATSTSGAYYGHPDPEAISRVLKFGSSGHKTLYFNYASERTLPWDDAPLQEKYDYECIYPSTGNDKLVIDI